ncbi:protein kinase [Archangium violaceum]|uniref:bifunctional serine/threonine-protein kinase/formylglycine-generating enzyme family protein n=1 Tax=Archangium violaceum TaxID=83451 RepID=UPI00193C60D7|nr:bifunctional serine/threonine-protein kinase/formylglycine-generating enzyme family protein [Archangium violaceum]QRK11264.1 protein kinase [Archangium violaceum]
MGPPDANEEGTGGLGGPGRPEDRTQTIAGPAPKAALARPKPGPAWTPPTEFNEFRLERLLGRGGMGIVYLAHDTSLGRPVAVKFIAPGQPEPQVRAYFETEARAIARLQHPNVVTVFRVGSVGEHPYIVSEYVVGRSLSELPHPLPWRRALTIGVGLARGLAAAHRQGVLHRDIKPSNALVTADGEVKLLDFGLAEQFDPSESSRPPGTHEPAGTPNYMAPELLLGVPASPQSDIYSLGLTLYKLCTGHLPSRPSPKGAAVSALEQEKALSRGLGGDIDADFAALILRCLAPDPAERFASADQLREDLERLEQRHASTPLAAGNPYRGLAPFEAEHRALFFGRDADIRAVLERLRHQSLALVAGDSGVGKSSLCRAGVLPRVSASAVDEGREIYTVTLYPGHRPLQALAAALAPLLGRREAEVVTALTDTPAWLGQALREAYSGKRGLLLFVDQLEELITLAEPVQALRFAAVLGELALPSAGVRVLLAVRGDFLTRVCALPGLGDEAERALYILRPMSPEGVREAIVGPARSRGVVFESRELIQTLVDSTANGAGSLPLLQFALAELWERHNPAHGRITRAALDEMGGVAGALSRHADGVLARLSPAEQQAARRLLLQLVTAEGTRGERSEEELVAASDADSRAALHALIEGRLLHARSTGGKARYGIAHDSLITSWGTLRNWLDDDIGHRAVRQRVEVASAEWERLGRARDALWGQRQLDETRPLDSTTLGPREHAFLQASRRALSFQRWGQTAALLLGVLALAALYGGLRLQAYLEDARFVADAMDTARKALAEGRTLGQEARARREEALALFDGRAPPSSGPDNPPGPHDLRPTAERRWDEALGLLEKSDAAHLRATMFLERALERERGHAEARRLLLEVTHERMLLAEHFHQQRILDEQGQRLEQLLEGADDGSEWRRRLSAPAELQLVTSPPGARVRLERYVPDERGVLRPQYVQELGQTPITRALLPAGSYLLHITAPGHAPVDLPLLLTRGETERRHLELPTRVPPGYVYIPPGCFLQGTAKPEELREFMSSAPLHRTCLNEAYLIGRTEVTFGDWVTYLDTLPPNAAARRILEQPHFSHARAITLRHQPGTGWVFSFHRSREGVLSARDGEPFRYPDRTRRDTADWRQFPLSGVSAEDLAGYFYWLDHSGRLPGARLCSEFEWERAARGADGREYPHGERLLPDDANIDVTYARQPMAYGPDMVGSHPISTSPFGLVDMTGNAYELTRPVTPDLGRIVLRGGGWYYDIIMALAANRSAGDPTQRDPEIGVRVCASVSSR